MKFIKLFILSVFISLISFNSHAIERILDDKWCEGKKIHSFAGGPEGDAFAAIVAAGIENAFKHTGADGKVIYSGWDTNKMLQSVRESISMGVDGISVMGFAGHDAMMPIAKMANDAGVLMNYMVVDVPDVRKQYDGGYVGADLGSASTVPDAIRKATTNAKKTMNRVSLNGETLFHEANEKFSGAKVLLKPAAPGTGVIAGGGVRAVMEAVGVKDVLSKTFGSSNTINIVRCTLNALYHMRDPQVEFSRRRDLNNNNNSNKE